MTAILRWGTALLSLLLLTSVSHGYYWVSGAFKTPLPHAPDTRNSGFYLLDAYGRWTGPHYYLVPPVQPFSFALPGPTGQAIMSGNLPHNVLLGKNGLSIGNAPLLGPPPQPAGHPHHAAMGPNSTLGTPAMQQYGMMQMPHAAMATGPYAMPAPYAGAMPYQGMQAPMGYGPKPMMWAPYPVQAPPQPRPGPQAVHWKDSNGIWQVQNKATPNGIPVPYLTIPGFHHGHSPAPPKGSVPTMSPMQPMDRLQLPRPEMMPQMGMPNVGGSAYPVHPFTRSPRDFFMWGEVMEEERARGNRPLPVP